MFHSGVFFIFSGKCGITSHLSSKEYVTMMTPLPCVLRGCKQFAASLGPLGHPGVEVIAVSIHVSFQ